jgi:hypothetical protein
MPVKVEKTVRTVPLWTAGRCWAWEQLFRMVTLIFLAVVFQFIFQRMTELEKEIAANGWTTQAFALLSAIICVILSMFATVWLSRTYDAFAANMRRIETIREQDRERRAVIDRYQSGKPDWWRQDEAKIETGN